MTKDRKILIGIIAVLALLFAYNSGGKTKTPEATPTVVQQAPQTTTPDTLSIYDLPDAIRIQDSWFNNVDDTSIIEVSMSLCGALQRGASIQDVADVAAQTIGIEHAPALIAGAIVYICPDQQYKVPS